MADLRDARVKSVLDDPSTQAISRVYARAFLSAAGDDGAGTIEEFDSFIDVLDGHDDFRSVFLSGIMSRDEQLGVIDRVVAPRASEKFANFLRVLAEHDRLSLLPAILVLAKLDLEKRNGQQRVEVISAKELDAATLERVRNQINDTFDFEPIIESSTDPGLIGGLVIRVANKVYDGSLRSRVNQLAKRLQQGSLHEIQSGRDRFSTD
ncbi:MAG: ATP synthase F1 subunit delta [Planctomycetes bacterium]|nr:ATP synthase F1 subunit delta [Planctomycetota bacterium]